MISPFLERFKASKTNFIRSSSFHDSLRRSNRNDQKLLRTYSTSPPNTSSKKTNDSNLKRSKSSKEITVKSVPTQRSKATNKKDHHDTNRISSTTSFIPFINQCIQSEKTPRHSKSPLPLPKRAPPPIPKKLSSSRTAITTVDNHIYDSFQDSPPSLTNSCQQTCSYRKSNDDDNRTVPQSRLPPMKVTEL